MDSENKKAEVQGVDIEKLATLVVGNLVGFAEEVGGVKKTPFAYFVGSLAGSYEEVGVDLDLRFTVSMIACWCGFAGIDVPGWCIGDGVKASVKNGRLFRQMADATYDELRKRGVSINNATISATRVKGASA